MKLFVTWLLNICLITQASCSMTGYELEVRRRVDFTDVKKVDFGHLFHCHIYGKMYFFLTCLGQLTLTATAVCSSAVMCRQTLKWNLIFLLDATVSWTTTMLRQSTLAARASVTNGTTWEPSPRRGGMHWRYQSACHINKEKHYGF